MNKTTVALVAVIVVLGGSFAWYAANHPDRGSGSGDNAEPGSYSEEAGASAEPRTLTLDSAITGLDTLGLAVGVGEVHVSASNDDQLHVQVKLRQKEHEFFGFLHWSQSANHEIAKAALLQDRKGKRLSLSLDLGRRDQDDIKQEWEVQVPVRLKLDAVMNVGEMIIKDVAGGVGAKLDVGELNIEVPHGAIDADVNVGEIRARSASAKHGRIELASNIGEAVLLIKGSQSGIHEHGGLGNRVSMDGDGPDSMQLKLNIGEVTLHLDPEGTDKSGGGK